MRTTHSNPRHAFGTPTPKTKLGKVKNIGKWAGIGAGTAIGATLIVTLCIILGSIDTLGTIFIVLKLTNNIDWSWFLVLSPYIATIALGVAAMIVVLIGFMIDSRNW
jgi:hypothetical protein